MAAQVRAAFLLALLALAGCAETPPIRRIALLAPFEGPYREIGYQALYATRMAIAEVGATHLELLAIDDGGTRATATDRARALNQDPLIEAVILLGPYATASPTINELQARIEPVIVGSWASSLEEMTGTNPPNTCDDICMMNIFAVRASDATTVTIQSQAPPLTPGFITAYRAFDAFAPEPLPIAGLTYTRVSELLSDTPATPSTEVYRYHYNENGNLTLVEARP